jgi:hypothetical protein
MLEPEADEILESFLEGSPRADTWGELRQALETRLDAAREQGNEAKLKELRAQIAALAQEEAISRFVEDSVRVTLVRPRVDADDNEFEIL